MLKSELDSTNTDMCNNGDFSESQVNDDHLEGYHFFAGFYNKTSNCSQHSILPLPENSSPDINNEPLFHFDLNPNNNHSIFNLLPPDRRRATFDRIELFEEDSEKDENIQHYQKSTELCPISMTQFGKPKALFRTAARAFQPDQLRHFPNFQKNTDFMGLSRYI